MVEDARLQYRTAAEPPSGVLSGPAVLPAGGLDEVAAKSLLEGMGLACPTRFVCDTRASAHAAFVAHAGPMVAKVIDKAIPHKTEVGGVHVNISTIAQLDEALDRIDAIPGTPRPYLLEEMAPDGLELIIGAVRDPSFGPVVLVGLGGTIAEALKDVSRRVAPITAVDAQEMLDELRGRALLDGWRGNAAVSRPSVIQAMLAVSAIIVTCESVGEIEINPFRVYPDRGLVLDALFVPTRAEAAIDP
jgi:acetyltransferase